MFDGSSEVSSVRSAHNVSRTERCSPARADISNSTGLVFSLAISSGDILALVAASRWSGTARMCVAVHLLRKYPAAEGFLSLA